MKIGLDLDGTVYQYPEFFGAFVDAMDAAGHRLFCTTGHPREDWPQHAARLERLGIDPSKISPARMLTREQAAQRKHLGWGRKATMYEGLDVVFDDQGRKLLPHSPCPVFITPSKKSF